MLAASDVLTLSNFFLVIVIAHQMLKGRGVLVSLNQSTLLTLTLISLSILSNTINFRQIVEPVIVIHHFKELFLALLFIFYLQIIVTSRGVEECRHVLYLMAKITISFGIIDFVSMNTGFFNLDEIIPRSNVQHNSGSIASISRLRGTFEEAGYYGKFATLLLIPILYSPSSNHLKYITTWRVLLILSVILTFSVVSLVALLLTVILMFTMKFVRARIRYNTIAKLIAGSTSLALIIYQLRDLGLLELMQNKLFGQHQSKSARIEKFETHLDLINVNSENFLNLLFGASTDLFKQINGTGSLNNYLELLSDFGLFGCSILIIISVFLLYKNCRGLYIIYLVPLLFSLGLQDVLYGQLLISFAVLSIVNQRYQT